MTQKSRDSSIIEALEKSKSAHRRLDHINNEVIKIRERQVQQGLITENHNTLLIGLSSSITELSKAVKDFDGKANKIIFMVTGGTFAGSAVVTFCYFLGKEVFKLW